MINITLLRHSYPENAGFCINRPVGYPEYTFLHFHTPMQIVLNGELVLTQPHALIIYDIGTPQFFKSDMPVIHDWMHFTGDPQPLLKNIKLNTLYYPNQHGLITKTVAELEQEFFSKRNEYLRLLQIKTEEMFIKLNRDLFNSNFADYDKNTLEKFRDLRGKVFYSLNEEWTVGKMASEVYLSESRFFTLYKSIFGISPIADLINAKINSAKNMLLFSDKNVEQIAAALCYQNTTHFIRQFKKIVGVSPSAFKKDYPNG